jgi:hypothetical protein
LGTQSKSLLNQSIDSPAVLQGGKRLRPAT